MNANCSSIITCLFLLMVLLNSQLVFFTQARPLVEEKHTITRRSLSAQSSSVPKAAVEGMASPTPFPGIEDVRPTQPGHSPGVGNRKKK
ncbi:hypothetical protein LUZ62_075162 [Rhynchospora pubera]|uniref:Transmembrane protein n=1 Tax=Rhynchospora pubera TaxID=906938 RepID=A0AAV8DDT1_9POAL|nr:hypothetical protein LUZ62_075162 [Rhynchospora pubera]